jgi:hypothetical protein
VGEKTQCKGYSQKKSLLFMVVFIVQSGSQLGPLKTPFGSKHFADDEEVETKMWKCLRQQSKDFYAAGFNALVKRWDKSTNVGGGYVKK